MKEVKHKAEISRGFHGSSMGDLKCLESFIQSAFTSDES